MQFSNFLIQVQGNILGLFTLKKTHKHLWDKELCNEIFQLNFS